MVLSQINHLHAAVHRQPRPVVRHRTTESGVLGWATGSDEAQKKLGLESDAAFSKHIGGGDNRTLVSNWRNKCRTPDDYYCIVIAEILGIDPPEITTRQRRGGRGARFDGVIRWLKRNHGR